MLSKLIRRSCSRIQYHRTSHSDYYFTKRSIVHHSSGDAIIRQFATKSATILSLSDIISYTGSTEERMRDYGKFIWREIPIRISRRVVELHSLPYNLSNAPAIIELRELYTHSFHSFRMLEIPDTDAKEEQFINQMKTHFESLKSAVPLIATGVTQSIMANPNQAPLIQSCPFLNAFLDRFFAARLGTRLLTGQYIACKEQRMKQKPISNIVGLIDFECNPKAILESAADDAARMCETNYGTCPDVEIKVQDKNIRFAYIPSDLHYIFFELMKNAMRAVCVNSRKSGNELEPIECVIVASQESDDVTVKISDQGGGISRENMEQIWLYSFSTITTNKPEVNKNMNTYTAADGEAPMAGFGYGLPLSRLYARYFSGDLEVISMDGFGTDVFVYLNWLKPDDTRKLTATDALESVHY